MAGFGDQLAKALAADVAVAKPATGTGQLALRGFGASAPVAMEPGAVQQITPGPSVADQSSPIPNAAVQDVPVQKAPVPDAQVQAGPEPVPAASVPIVEALPLPLPSAQPTEQQPNGIAQRPRATHTDRRESKGDTAETKTEDAAVADQPVATALPPLPLVPPLPVDSALPAEQGPGHNTTASDAKAGSCVVALTVGPGPGANPAVGDAKPSAVPSVGTHAAPHQAEAPPGSAPSLSDQFDASQGTMAQAVPPSGTPLAQHPPTVDAAPVPVATPAGTAPFLGSSAHASPAAQMAPALVALSHAPDGTQRLTMRLAPPELGQVQIRIDRLPDAPARVDITVEKTETLTLLLRDQPQLQRALDQAGVPPEGRSVTFHVVPAEPPQRIDAIPVPSPSSASSNGLAGEYSQGASRQGGHPAQQQTAADGSDDAVEVDVPPPAWTRWSRAGLDITA